MALRSVIEGVRYAGLAVAMVGGARWPHPQWGVVLLGVLVLVLASVWQRRVEGVVLPELTTARGSMGVALDAAHDLPASLRALVERVRGDEGLEGAALVTAIEDVLRGHVEAIAAAQDDVLRRRGFESWARLMGPTAVAERLLHRAWSAASDGHREEAERSLTEAVTHAEDAARAALGLRERGGS
jgi:hypothetical protein